MDSIRLSRLVISDYKLLREPTEQEMAMIKNGEMFDTEDLIDWDSEEVFEEDYSFGFIKSGYVRVNFNNKTIYERKHY